MKAGVVVPTLFIRQPDREPWAVSLADGRHTLGASESASIRVDGVPPVAMELVVSERGTTLMPYCAIVVGGLAHPAGFARWLRPGEEAVLGSLILMLEAAPQDDSGTVTLARDLLGSLVSGAPSEVLPSLTILTGKDCGRRALLVEEENVVGRGNECAARVRDRFASRRHAKVVVRGDRVSLVDLGAPNGTLVDGAVVKGEVELRGGEVLQIGDTLLGLDLGAAAPVAPSSGLPAAAVASSSLLAGSEGHTEAAVEASSGKHGDEWGFVLAGALAFGMAAAVVAVALM